MNLDRLDSFCRSDFKIGDVVRVPGFINDRARAAGINNNTTFVLKSLTGNTVWEAINIIDGKSYYLPEDKIEYCRDEELD